MLNDEYTSDQFCFWDLGSEIYVYKIIHDWL